MNGKANMKLFPTIRVLLWSISLLLAVSSPAQEINRQVGEPIGGINLSVNPEFNAEVSRQPTGESASGLRTAPPASTFGTRSQSASAQPTASTSSFRNLPHGHPNLEPPATQTPVASQKHTAHSSASVSASAPSHLAFGGSQGESVIASAHSHGGKQVRRASATKLFAAQNHNTPSGGNAPRSKTKSAHTKQRHDK